MSTEPRDGFSIDEKTSVLIDRANRFAKSTASTDEQFCLELSLAQKKGWDINKARKRMKNVKSFEDLIQDISYRPFDNRKIIFDESVVWTTARSTMDHMITGSNIALVSARSEKSGTSSHFYVSEMLVETKCGERTTQSAVFPLYLYPAEDELDQSTRVNMEPKIRARIEAMAMGKPDIDASGHATPAPQHEGEIDITPRYDADGRPNEVAIFDYIYGVLHCPAYRETYKEFLKIDFPRIPYPPSPKVFRDMQEKGTALRRLHLMEDDAIGETPYPFDGDGDSIVGKVAYEDGAVFINDTQYFQNVPEIAWNFYIGGYQPAQKWLKDRKGRTLSLDDILHYQKIIKILVETDRIMKTIEMPLDG